MADDLAQLMMMAVYRAAGGWPALQRALPLLAELERRGGMEELGMFVIYVLATQDEPMRRRFAKELQRHVPGPGGDAMNYVEELIKQGRQKGRLEERVGTIEDFLRAGASWSLIESATGMDPAALRALKQRLEAASTTTEPNETSAQRRRRSRVSHLRAASRLHSPALAPDTTKRERII